MKRMFVFVGAICCCQLVCCLPSAWSRVCDPFGKGLGCTCSDFNNFTAQIASGIYDPKFDLNDDGMLDTADLTLFLSVAASLNGETFDSYLFGDANLDGTVDGLDFISWNDHKFTAEPAWCSGDFNADGIVDGLDFIVWNSNKFQTASDVTLIVPEPKSNLPTYIAIILGLLSCHGFMHASRESMKRHNNGLQWNIPARHH